MEKSTTARTAAENPDDQKYFDFLVELRDSRRVNMWGAAPFVAKKFRIPEKKASEVLVRWIDSFSRVTA